MKKDFSNTAAAAFVTQPKPAPETATPVIETTAPDEQGAKLMIIYRKPNCNPGEEARTLRKQLLMRPSVFNAISDYAQGHKMSFNSITELAIEYYMQTHDKTGKQTR